MPTAIDLGDGGACRRCGTCDAFVCRFGAKGDAETRLIACIRSHPDVTILTEAEVTRLIPDAAGRRILAAELRQGGETRRITAPLFVLGARAINSALILLRSATEACPEGLANRSGVVGRNLMNHHLTGLMGLLPFEVNATRFAKTLSVNDFCHGLPGDPAARGNIQMLGNIQGPMIRATYPAMPRPLADWLGRPPRRRLIPQRHPMPHNFLLPITGSFAMPAAENPTVAMIEAAFRDHGLNWRYINLEVAPENLGNAVRGARAMGWRGFNCSIPHKVAVIDHLDGLGASAAIIGAVNTVVRRGDALIGENTNGKGFVAALRAICDAAGQRVVQFGAGGAARAVAVELALAGVDHITVVNRDPGRGAAVARLVAEKTPASADHAPWHGPYRIPAGTGIVVNATSVGLWPDVAATPDIDHATLSPDMVVADGIHNPPLTKLLQAARARGCRTADGLGMLVGQGVIGLKHWTGIDADPAVMRQALLDLGL